MESTLKGTVLRHSIKSSTYIYSKGMETMKKGGERGGGEQAQNKSHNNRGLRQKGIEKKKRIKERERGVLQQRSQWAL